MRLLEIVTNWIILICVMTMIMCFVMAISGTSAHLILHGNPWN